ncbi:general regulatory factor 2 [Medicago truncatula]|uniref:General regulatory factor 2 n=1 Tax=Medicago truncatula TaxID=3880 RepID=A0A072TGU2_MEDTR|nr:general regulatory factor 2 [Medicago truncatula]
MGFTVAERLRREEYVFHAKLAQQAERYEEMVSFMQKIVVGYTPASELSLEEMNLLSVAYKNATEPLRAALRILSKEEEGRKNEDDHFVHVKKYKSKVESELENVCGSILELLDSKLIPSASSSEIRVVYYQMKGDYQRYMAEFKIGDDKKSAVEDIILSYKAAQDIAAADLRSSHPIRLGLALNFSVFYYEILNRFDEGLDMARQALDEARNELKLGDEYYKDSTVRMQLLRNNITLWTFDDTDQLDEH